MPYVPRPATTAQCAHCGTSFEKRHASRRYCSNSCNVQASYARNGRPGEPRATRADLELMLAKMMALMNVTPELATASQATAKVPTKKPAAKAAVKPAPVVKKKVTKPVPHKPAAEAAATKPAAPAAKAAAAKSTRMITAEEVEMATTRAKMLREFKREQKLLKEKHGLG